jgi:hypothetical protein
MLKYNRQVKSNVPTAAATPHFGRGERNDVAAVIEVLGKLNR